MRYKLGFVTNSSSVSFVGYGIYIDDIDYVIKTLPYKYIAEYYKLYKKNIEWLNEKYPDEKRQIPSLEEFMEDPTEYDEDMRYEFFDSMKGLETRTSDWGTYIGVTMESMDPDETKNQAKERCTKLFQELGFKEEPYWIDEAWRDG